MSVATVTVNPHSAQPVSPKALVQSLVRNQQLIFQMIKREVLGRYRGSAMGLTWSFVNPIIMLIVYTIVFSEVFKTRWSNASVEQDKTQFAIVLFAGLILLNFFSEVVNRAPNLILANVNYVKKVIFPVEILPVVAIGSALFHSLASFLVLLSVYVCIHGFLHWTVVFLPIVVLPLVILILGVTWLLASLGVFLRDVGQSITIVTTILTFLSPIFYPISAVPERLRPIILLNPLTFIIEQVRDVLVWGNTPNWQGLTIYLILAMIVAFIGFAWFQKTRKGFADVL